MWITKQTDTAGGLFDPVWSVDIIKMDQQQPVTVTQPIKLLQECNWLQQLIPQVLVILEPFLLITH